MTVSDPRDAERAKAQAWNAEFEAALARTAASVSGLNCHTTRDQPHLGLPRLFWDGDASGAYWASAGLLFTAVPADTLAKATATLHYRRQSPDAERFERDEKPLATLDIGTTDPHLVAALLVTAAQHHRAAL
ncbi:hypothetical protein [Streptomyces sp. NPDC097610]|uniref:hypothetical protein n=1 Tax=Streptomyces sp. NPDC097610 TaxID=3157227 RepID=UPI0033283107